MSKFLCAALALGTVSALTIPASAADYAGRWEISGRQFGMVPSFHPISDGRLVISGSGGNYTATYNALRFSGSEQKDGLHLDCTDHSSGDGKSCGAFVLQETKGKLTGIGTMSGERIDIAGQRPAAKPAGATAHEFVPKQFHTNFSGATETVRFVTRNFDGALKSNATYTLDHLATKTASTHNAQAYSENLFLVTGIVKQGTTAIAATSINIICTAETIDASSSVLIGVARRGIRFNAAPGSQE